MNIAHGPGVYKSFRKEKWWNAKEKILLIYENTKKNYLLGRKNCIFISIARRSGDMLKITVGKKKVVQILSGGQLFLINLQRGNLKRSKFSFSFLFFSCYLTEKLTYCLSIYFRLWDERRRLLLDSLTSLLSVIPFYYYYILTYQRSSLKVELMEKLVA